MRKSGAGILTGALTTAILFFALIMAKSAMVKELGLIASLGAVVKKRPIFFALFMLALGLLPATQAPKVQVEGNLMNMEAKGLESLELQYRMVEEFSMAPDMMSVITPDISEMRRPAKRIKKPASVKAVESLGTYYPLPEEQSTRAEQAVRFAPFINNSAQQLLASLFIGSKVVVVKKYLLAADL